MECRLDMLQAMIDWLASRREGAVPSIVDHSASYYLYLSYMAKIVGIATAGRAFVVIQVLAASFCVTLYPVLTWSLFDKNGILAILAPFLWYQYNGRFLVTVKTDSYWVMSWIVTMALPILFLLLKRQWDKVSYLLYVLLLVLMGMGNLPRSHASVAVLCVTLVALAIKVRKLERETVPRFWMKKAALFVGCVVAYFMFTSLIPTVYMKVAGVNGLIQSFPAWHTIYVGAGWEENPYHIIYNDTCGADKAEEIEPGVSYNSERYFEVLKEECFRMWRENPKWFVGSYFRKAVTCVKKVVAYYSGAWVIGISLLLTWIKKTCRSLPLEKRKDPPEKKWFLFATVMVYGMEMFFPLMARPDSTYLTGMAGAWGLFLFLLTCYGIQDIMVLVKQGIAAKS